MDVHVPSFQDDSDIRPGDHPFLRGLKLDSELRAPQDIQPPRTANVVRHPDFGAAILVVDGSGTPLYIPKSKAQLVRLIEDAARLLGELERL